MIRCVMFPEFTCSVKMPLGALYLYIWEVHNIPQDSTSSYAPFGEPFASFFFLSSRYIAGLIAPLLHRNGPFMAAVKFMLPFENRIAQIYNKLAALLRLRLELLS